jgi:hypothetical protein
MPHSENAFRRLADGCERFGEKLMQYFLLGLATLDLVVDALERAFDLLFEFRRLSLELVVRKLFDRRFKTVDLIDERPDLFQKDITARTK